MVNTSQNGKQARIFCGNSRANLDWIRKHLPVSLLPTMHLYNLTLQGPTSVTQAIVGNFSGARHQEIIVARGTRLELFRPDASSGKMTSLLSHDVYGSVRSLVAFRLTGGSKGELLAPALDSCG